MVKFTGEWTSNCQYNTRFGCGSVLLDAHIRVRPVEHADLGWKRVGVVYRSLIDSTEKTAIGSYSRTLDNGDEEWRVSFAASGSEPVVVFDAWYQDGLGNTWIDDNQGELHVISAGPAYSIIPRRAVAQHGRGGRERRDRPALGAPSPISTGTSRSSSSRRKDHWQTTLRFGIGASTEEEQGVLGRRLTVSGRERWRIDWTLPAARTGVEDRVRVPPWRRQRRAHV